MSLTGLLFKSWWRAKGERSEPLDIFSQLCPVAVLQIAIHEYLTDIQNKLMFGKL